MINKPLKSIQQSMQDEDIRLEDRALLLYIEWSGRHFDNLPLDRHIKSEKASCAGIKEKYSGKKICLVQLGKNLFAHMTETERARMRVV